MVCSKVKSAKQDEAQKVEHGRAPVGGAHAFMLMISRAVGFAPLSFHRPPGSKKAFWLISISPAYCAANYVVGIIMMMWSLYGMVEDLANSNNRIRKFVPRDCVYVLIGTTASAIGVLSAPARSKTDVRVLRLLASVDKCLGLEPLYTQKSTIKRLWLAIVIILTFLTLYAGVFVNNMLMYGLDNWMTIHMGFYLQYCAYVILEIHFAFMGHQIYLRLWRLNSVLASTGQKICNKGKKVITKNKPIFIIEVRPGEVRPRNYSTNIDVSGTTDGADRESKFNGEEIAERIRCLSKLHRTVCAAAREVNNSYDPTFLMTLINVLLNLSFSPIDIALEIGGARRPRQLIVKTFWFLTTVARLLLLVEPCHRIKVEAGRTGYIVADMLDHAPAASSLLRRLELFSRQLLHHEPVFTAMGFCTLDRPLIASVTGLVTTYLVIMIQFNILLLNTS